MDEKTYKIAIYGIVQGVGFRPFLYNLAKNLSLRGHVYNTTGGVVLIANFQSSTDIGLLLKKIRNHRPKASFIEEIKYQKTSYQKFKDFKITKSKSSAEDFQLISPDIATCRLCLEDIHAAGKRRHDYAFTNCTNCGPRFTIIKKMPYDRPNTTMAPFQMCPDCLDEYRNPSDRRFHAQPNACARCGPRLTLFDHKKNKIDTEDPLLECSKLLKDGQILAIKSLGGFQIAANATEDSPLRKLRERKKRPFKPFALMVKDIAWAKKLFLVSAREEKSLLSSKAPIVLLQKKRQDMISGLVSSYSDREGVMLAYSPLHHILFKHLDLPLVMTSANISEEPILSKNEEAFKKLSGICDYFLMHDRKISSKYDDSLIRVFDDREMLLRRARGYAPYPLKLSSSLKDKVVFAAGSHEKNTFCFLRQDYAIISQHIGDLENYETSVFYDEAVKNYKKIFDIKEIDCIVYDLHPNYYSTKAAKEMESTKKIALSHHKAHIASVIAENHIKEDLIGFAWDGTGLGEDGKLWGSEVFLTRKNLSFKRIAHLSEYKMPGGTASIHKPYRMALSFLYTLYANGRGGNTSFSSFVYKKYPFYKNIVSEEEIIMIQAQIKSGFNTPLTTSMGRLFDAVSSLLDLTHQNSYEGEAAVHLQMRALGAHNKAYPFQATEVNGKIIIDVHDLISKIVYDLSKGVDAGLISAKFHNTLSHIIGHLSKILRESYGIHHIALSGGVFQNPIILKKSFDLLKKSGFKVYSNFNVPVNDACVSLGQAYYGFKKIFDS